LSLNTHNFIFNNSNSVPPEPASRLEGKAGLTIAAELYLPTDAIMHVSHQEGRLLGSTDHNQRFVPDFEAFTERTVEQAFAVRRVDAGDRWELIDNARSQDQVVRRNLAPSCRHNNLRILEANLRGFRL
jgi:hypothetical protein